ncbi:distal tail protein Dit [Peptostreptococcus porci]|uniref:distal tail protein Dit n=1 Tax=Peptostreptococcus porci TaxID=2652282 RepID=UPI002A91AC53|nr:distal tail protein Dit [Peptostreptococcus porci]MDY6232836.1 phage tail family protein [Peptostreptococcus porci]
MGLVIKTKNKYIDLSEKGLCIKERPKIPTPKMRMEKINVSGRDGTLTIKDSFEDIEIKVELNIMEDDVKKVIRSFKNIIFDTTEISFSDDDKFFYKVKNVEIDDIENEVDFYGSFLVNFVCDPYIYQKDTFEYKTVANNIVIQGYKSMPLIKITPSSTGSLVSFTIDGKQMTINNSTNPIYIDCSLMRVYSDTQSILRNVTGEFFELGTGEHKLNLKTNISKFEIQTREGWL